MKKIFYLISLLFFLNGCFGSVAMFGTGAANGRVVQSSLSSVTNYNIKKKTGKGFVEHLWDYSKKDDRD